MSGRVSESIRLRGKLKGTIHVVRLKVFRLKAEGKRKLNIFFRDKAVAIIQ